MDIAWPKRVNFQVGGGMHMLLKHVWHARQQLEGEGTDTPDPAGVCWHVASTLQLVSMQASSC